MAETEDTKQEAAEALQVEPVIAETVMVTDAEVPAQTQPSAQAMPSGQVLAEESKTAEPETNSEEFAGVKVEVVEEFAPPREVVEEFAPPRESPSDEKKQDAHGPSGQVEEPETEKGLARKEQASDCDSSGYVEIQLDAHGTLAVGRFFAPMDSRTGVLKKLGFTGPNPFPTLKKLTEFLCADSYGLPAGVRVARTAYNLRRFLKPK